MSTDKDSSNTSSSTSKSGSSRTRKGRRGNGSMVKRVLEHRANVINPTFETALEYKQSEFLAWLRGTSEKTYEEVSSICVFSKYDAKLVERRGSKPLFHLDEAGPATVDPNSILLSLGKCEPTKTYHITRPFEIPKDFDFKYLLANDVYEFNEMQNNHIIFISAYDKVFCEGSFYSIDLIVNKYCYVFFIPDDVDRQFFLTKYRGFVNFIDNISSNYFGFGIVTDYLSKLSRLANDFKLISIFNFFDLRLYQLLPDGLLITTQRPSHEIIQILERSETIAEAVCRRAKCPPDKPPINLLTANQIIRT